MIKPNWGLGRSGSTLVGCSVGGWLKICLSLSLGPGDLGEVGGARGDDLWGVGEEALGGDDGDGVGSLPHGSGAVGVGVVGGGDQGGGRSDGNVAGEPGLFGEVGGLSSGNLQNKIFVIITAIVCIVI